MAPGDVQADPPRLTTRERQVLLAVADRLSNSDIAEQLCLSKRTVEAHVSALYAKTGATTRRQLVAMGERRREPRPAAPYSPPRRLDGRPGRSRTTSSTSGFD